MTPKASFQYLGRFCHFLADYDPELSQNCTYLGQHRLARTESDDQVGVQHPMPPVFRGVHEACVMHVIAGVQPAAADIVDQNVSLAQFMDCGSSDPARCLPAVEASSQSQPFSAQRIDFRGYFLHFGDGAGNRRDVGAFPGISPGDGPSNATATADNQAVLPPSCTSQSHL